MGCRQASRGGRRLDWQTLASPPHNDSQLCRARCLCLRTSTANSFSPFRLSLDDSIIFILFFFRPYQSVSLTVCLLHFSPGSAHSLIWLSNFVELSISTLSLHLIFYHSHTLSPSRPPFSPVSSRPVMLFFPYLDQ